MIHRVRLTCTWYESRFLKFGKIWLVQNLTYFGSNFNPKYFSRDYIQKIIVYERKEAVDEEKKRK